MEILMSLIPRQLWNFYLLSDTVESIWEASFWTKGEKADERFTLVPLKNKRRDKTVFRGIYSIFFLLKPASSTLIEKKNSLHRICILLYQLKYEFTNKIYNYDMMICVVLWTEESQKSDICCNRTKVICYLNCLLFQLCFLSGTSPSNSSVSTSTWQNKQTKTK